mmetsp:Transcript_5173/g.14835  ORF Transcript_5173/g.14835 Transcript_5173/m.14835 type:complete len:257 (+) Transcript_5173:443-1213(+)
MPKSMAHRPAFKGCLERAGHAHGHEAQHAEPCAILMDEHELREIPALDEAAVAQLLNKEIFCVLCRHVVHDDGRRALLEALSGRPPFGGRGHADADLLRLELLDRLQRHGAKVRRALRTVRLARRAMVGAFRIATHGRSVIVHVGGGGAYRLMPCVRIVLRPTTSRHAKLDGLRHLQAPHHCLPGLLEQDVAHLRRFRQHQAPLRLHTEAGWHAGRLRHLPPKRLDIHHRLHAHRLRHLPPERLEVDAFGERDGLA